MGEMLWLVGWLVGFAARVVEDGLRVVAARLWLNVGVVDGGGLM